MEKSKDKNNKKLNVSKIAIDFLFYVIASLLYAVSVNVFAAPNNIAAGGITGISTLFNYLFGTPIGIMIIILNIPLFIAGFFKLGWEFLIKTIIATVMLSIVIDITASWFPSYIGDQMLASIFGGAIMGLSLAVVFMRGATTGGTDILAKIIAMKYRHFSIGNLILGIDMVIIISAGFIYQNIENALYSMVMIFASTVVIDRVLYGTGSGTGKTIMIMSSHNKEIAKQIISNIGRGATLLKAEGAYTGKDIEVIFCAVRRHEIHKVMDIIKEIDPTAFTIIGNAGEISGEGFKSIED